MGGLTFLFVCLFCSVSIAVMEGLHKHFFTVSAKIGMLIRVCVVRPGCPRTSIALTVQNVA